MKTHVAARSIIAATLLALFVCAATCPGEEAKDAKDPKDDPQAKEQKFVDDLLTKNEMSTLYGSLLIGTAEEAPAALKQAGTLTVGKESFIVILVKAEQFKDLKPFDKQSINVVGFVTDKPDAGKVIYFDHIETEAPMAPSKRKRGGF